MKRSLRQAIVPTIFSGVLCTLLGLLNTAQAVEVFTKQTLGDLTHDYQGQPWVLLLWSVDCPPCYQELQALGELLEQHHDHFKVALVSTDPGDAMDSVIETLDRFDLDSDESWYFAADDGRALRYAIDPQWFGELPRAYFYDRQGQRQAHSGVVSQADLLAHFQSKQ